MKPTPQLARIATVAALAASLTVPAFAARGRADFSRYVALGDSFGAGVSNASLLQSHQEVSYPAIIARQAGAPDFQQPLVGEPGIGPELRLVNVISFPPVILPAGTNNGAPINLNLARPYNNLSIPGAQVKDLLTLTGREQPTNTARSFAQFILRGQGTAVAQAVALQPTFISVWIGGNDVLGAVLSGTPAALTPTADFVRDYSAVLDALIAGAPNAGMVVGTLPTRVASVPLTTTVPPVLINPATRQPVLGPDGRPIFYVADLGGGTLGQLPAGSLVLLTASTLLRTGYGIPAALASLFPTLPDVGKPLPDSVVLTPTEIAAIEARGAEYNAAIIAAANQRDIPVADIIGFFNRVSNGIDIGGVRLTNAYITGGIYSFDGFHLTDIGYTLFANEFIKAINRGYRTKIPLASIVRFYENNAFVDDEDAEDDALPVPVFEGMSWQISPEAVKMIESFAPRPEQVEAGTEE